MWSWHSRHCSGIAWVDLVGLGARLLSVRIGIQGGVVVMPVAWTTANSHSRRRRLIPSKGRVSIIGRVGTGTGIVIIGIHRLLLVLHGRLVGIANSFLSIATTLGAFFHR